MNAVSPLLQLQVATTVGVCIAIFILALAAAVWFSREIAYTPRDSDRYRMADVKCIYQNDGTKWLAFVRAPERDCDVLPRTAQQIKRGDLL